MTAEEQRIKIAEACGWKPSFNSDEWLFFWEKPDGSEGKLPDYLNDLNAMYAAESTIPADKWRDYVQELWWVIFGENEPGDDWDENAIPLIHATAAQRAEAFLRALGLWEEGGGR